MNALLLVFAILAFLAGGGILASAESAIHEIEAFLLFLIGAVFLSSAIVANAVSKVEKALVDRED